MANYQSEAANISRSKDIETSVTDSCFYLNEAETNNKGSSSVLCSLKRKRPLMIEIPNVLREILVEKEFCSQENARPTQKDVVCLSESGFAVFSLKGKKKFMEDAHKIASCPLTKKKFYGVYDGHGGSKAAEFVTDNLHSNIFGMLQNPSGNVHKEEAIKAGYLKTDHDFLKQGVGSGACCVTALIDDKEVVVSNLGDCRAVLCRGGLAEVITIDHRAGHEDERRRIEDMGGFVEHHRGAWRVHGVLSVSRSIGDSHLKEWVVADPDTKIINLTQDMEFLVLASDGLWEEVSGQEAVDIVRRCCLSEEKVHSADMKSKENIEEHGTINMSPSLKLRRVNTEAHGTINTSASPKLPRVNIDEHGTTITSLSPKLRRALIKSKKPGEGDEKVHSAYMKSKENIVEHGYISTSPSPKLRRINIDEHGTTITSPSPKLRRVLIKSKRPADVSGHKKKMVESWRYNEDTFGNENDSPPSKAQRISVTSHLKMKNTWSNNQENSPIGKNPACGGLIAVCKELTNLAVTRGSKDDITVMIIKLNPFKNSV